MALRLSKCIERGWIDNRGEGMVRGELWVFDQEHPVVLELDGNCLRDIAGCRVEFTNPNPGEERNMDGLQHQQQGWTGDMTASRRVRLDVPETYKGMPLDLGDFPRVERKPGEPTPIANCLYLEWYSRQNGRVVIETVTFDVSITAGPVWTMTEAEERDQAEANLTAFGRFLEQAQEAVDRQQFAEEDLKTSDEHEWEEFLREFDVRTEKYGKLLDQYADHPDRDRIVAREMGWDWLDDALDADARGLFDEDRKRLEEEMAETPDPEPNPETEGVDWVRDEYGHINHPLQLRVRNFSVKLWRRYKERGLLGENGDLDLHDMLFNAQTLGAKLAGALNGVAYREVIDGGFVVACLKRALKFINDGLAAAEKVRAKDLLQPGEVDEYVQELFAVREEMLALMQRFRELT